MAVLQLWCVCLINRNAHFCGASLPLNSSLPSGKPVLEVVHEVFRSSFSAQLDAEATPMFQESYRLKSMGLLIMLPLPELPRGYCPWPFFGEGLWQWFSKSLRLVSLGTKSWQESELYLPVQQSVVKMCYRIRKKWSNFKRKRLGAMAAESWQVCRIWGATW